MALSNLIFIGISEFGNASLEEILKRGYDVSGIITRKDDECEHTARKHNIPTFRVGIDQRKIEGKSEERIKRFVDKRKPDLMAMCVFETKLPEDIVNNYTIINFHGSCLPYYRGWAPINWQIIHGLDNIGMTVSIVSGEYDRGDVIARDDLQITSDTTAGEAYDLMQPRAAKMLANAVDRFNRGEKIKRERQPQESVHPAAPELKDNDTRIDWNRDAEEIHNLIRGCNPMEYAHAYLDDERILMETSRIISDPLKLLPGQIIGYNKNSFVVSCRSGSIKITSVMNRDERRYNMPRFVKKLKRKNITELY